jgi:zinc D-Ala-D-Ala carboxypeptidase
MKISDHISLKEATHSSTAKRKGIDNNPTEDHLCNMQDTALNVFEPVRDYFGVPIGITSFYRSEALNEAIGGSKTSQHSRGEAIDLDADVYGGVTNAEIFDYISENVDYDQLIWEFGNDDQPDWVHVSFNTKGKCRNQRLKAARVNGKTVYQNY